MKDGVSANDYNHRESSDGKTVRGSYKIQLSDGRIQTVNYKADSNGYVADVQYSDGQMNSKNQCPHQQLSINFQQGLAFSW